MIDAVLARPLLLPRVASLPVYGSGRQEAVEGAARLGSNESPFDPLPSVVAALSAAGALAHRYPEPDAAGLRAALAARLDVAVDQVAVGAGSLGVLQQVLAAFAGPGDEVVFPWRSFEAYPVVVGAAGARPTPVPLDRGDGIDLPAMLAAVTARTRVVLLCLPNNPTGTLAPADAVLRFLDALPDDVLVVLDEAYVEFVPAEQRIDGVALATARPNVCVLRTFSKAYGLAGLRVGYAVASTAVAAGIRRAALPFAVSAVAQAAAVASLEAQGELDERVRLVVAERDRVHEEVLRLGRAVPRSAANFLWFRASDGERVALERAFAKAHVVARSYAGAGIRVSIGLAAENDRVLEVLAAVPA